jgi:predicted transcriptional regulator
MNDKSSMDIVEEYLLENPKRWFFPRQLAEELSMSVSQTRNALRNLVTRKIVDTSLVRLQKAPGKYQAYRYRTEPLSIVEEPLSIVEEPLSIVEEPLSIVEERDLW